MNNYYSYIGVGSNINPQENIKNALIMLRQHLNITKSSTFYRTKPLFNKNNNKYINGVWQIKTDKLPEDIKQNILKKIENKLHRIRTNDKNASRTIDLDLILYKNQKINTDKIIVPDPDIITRPFLAFPLLELDPELEIPGISISIKEITNNLKLKDMIKESVLTKQIKLILESK